MNLLRNNIPNAITCLNVACGTLAIMAAARPFTITPIGLQGYQTAMLMIALAAVADFLDGFAARLLGAVSAIGKELDSLCDLVSFGVAPAMILYHLTSAAHPDSLMPLAAALIAVAGALRLARFNVDTRQTTSFIGLPIPANALFWIGFCWFYATHHEAVPMWAVAALVVLLSWLMNSPLPMFSLKMHNFSVRAAWPQYALLAGAVGLIALLGVTGLAATIVLYVILSIAAKLCQD